MLFLNLCRLEIEAEPWMEGVLKALLAVLTQNTAASTTEEVSAATESCLSAVPATFANEPPASVESLTETLSQSDLNSDVADSLKTDVLSSQTQFAGPTISDAVDVNSADKDTSDLQPPMDLPSLSSDIVLESPLVNVNDATEDEKKEPDSGHINEESLTHSLPPLLSMPLTIPLCPPRYLQLTLHSDEKLVSLLQYFHH